ncbi:hypothetical protein, partial [Aquabacterium sp.]|uniref:hypothetical protein n=1 Tax=Aquabacterium sp. TaxID=1872578 RepID=UPI0035B3D6C4
MPSAFSWPVAVPSALRAPAPVNFGYKGFPICQAKPSPGDSPKAIHLEYSKPQKANTGIRRADINQG